MGGVHRGWPGHARGGRGRLDAEWSGARARARGSEDGALIAVVDGLGHGPEAAAAARAAVETLNVQATAAGSCNLRHLLVAIHQALRGTRGAVAGVALVEACTGSLHYAGIGNTEVRIFFDPPPPPPPNGGGGGGVELPPGAVVVVRRGARE